MVQEEGTGKVLTWIKPCLKKKLNNCSTGETKREKRKVTWQDEVALEKRKVTRLDEVALGV